MVTLALAIALPATAAAQFVELGGSGRDIGIGHNGSAWLIGMNPVGGGNYGIYQYNGTAWQARPGGAVRIAVGPLGNAWVVNAAGEIYQWSGSNWIPRPGRAVDIAVSAIGIHVIGTDGQLYSLVGPDGLMNVNGQWTQPRCHNIAGYGVRFQRLAAAPNGDVWAITAEDQQPTTWHPSRTFGAGAIIRFPYLESRCYLVEGGAHDIGIGGNGKVWVIGRNTTGGGYGIYRFECFSDTAGMPEVQNTGCWLGIPGGATQISVHMGGRAWVLNSNNALYRWQ